METPALMSASLAAKSVLAQGKDKPHLRGLQQQGLQPIRYV
jgi:hypothetical protein